jgi:hypothetical protein
VGTHSLGLLGAPGNEGLSVVDPFSHIEKFLEVPTFFDVDVRCRDYSHLFL